jgi:hypothetical protein
MHVGLFVVGALFGACVGSAFVLHHTLPALLESLKLLERWEQREEKRQRTKVIGLGR